MKRWITLWLVVLLCLTACSAAPAQPMAENTDVMPEEAQAENEAPKAPEEPSTPDERTVLCLGGLDAQHGLDGIGAFVSAFNQQSSQYRVELVDYCEISDSWEQGEMKLNTELMASSGPDMLFFNAMNVMFRDGSRCLSPLPYIGRGILMDMTPLLEADPETDAEDILIWDALMEYGGLYLMTSQFYVDTVMCSQATYETYAPWTIETYLQLEASLEEGQMMMYTMSPCMYLAEVCGRYIRSAMDLTEASCDFDNPEFISLLRAATKIKSYDSTITDGENLRAGDGSFKHASLRVAQGELIGVWETPWSASDIAFDRVTGEEAEPAYIGWPTADGSSGSDVVPLTAVGICSNTEQTQGCWEFVSFLLKHPNLSGPHYSTPAYRPRLKASLKAQQTINSKLNPQESDLEIMIQLSESCQNLTYYDKAILNIILEEADAMFDGNATAEEVARRVQDRASLYMMEQYG